MKPTPGGRWKVRQLIDGKYFAYVEQGKHKKFSKAFPTYDQAISYAHAQGYLAQALGNNPQFKKLSTRDRELPFRVLFEKAQPPITKALIDSMIKDVLTGL